MRWTSIVLALLLPAIVCAQFDIPPPRVPRAPDVGDVARDTLKIRIPDLTRILDEPAAISTSFEDAVFSIPFLDTFEPITTAPMSQLPYDGNGGFIVALPGLYELRARSFCLHAGTHGPGRGEGYLYAPLKGAKAGFITSLMDRYINHPEIDQQMVQSLIWGIQAKTKVSDMPVELRNVAATLLTRSEIRSLDGGALGLVPQELFDQAFVGLPPEVRMVMEAEAQLRNRLRQEVWNFGALEQIAVLSGDPDFPDDAEVPRGRWSFEPDGYFVRYFPDGYPETTVQLYSPEDFNITGDASDRINSIVGHDGLALQLRYAAGSSAAPGDGGVVAHLLEAMILTTPDGSITELAAGVPVLTGIPSGAGRFGSETDALYAPAVQVAGQVRELARHVSGASPDSPLLGNVMNLAHLCNTVDLIAKQTPGDAAVACQGLFKRAWASELALLLAGVEPQAMPTWTPSSPAAGVRLALLLLPGGTLLSDAGFSGDRLAWNTRPSPSGRSLPVFKPSRGSATPANRGRQRIGVSGNSRQLETFDPRAPRDPDRPPRGADGKSAAANARKGIDAFQNGKQVIDIVTGPVGAARDAVGFGIPNYLFGKILDFNFDAWGRATKALDMDPPRGDFTEIAIPELLTLPTLTDDQALSPEHARAINALMQAMAANLAVTRAGVISVDRLGGALAAGQDEWATRQAATLIGYKRQAGGGMLTISECLTAVLRAIEAAGINDIRVTAEAAAAYQQRLRTEGFKAEELQAARMLGIGDEELQAMLSERIAADPQQMAGSVLEETAELAEALWWLGMSWSQLPGQ